MKSIEQLSDSQSGRPKWVEDECSPSGAGASARPEVFEGKDGGQGQNGVGKKVPSTSMACD